MNIIVKRARSGRPRPGPTTGARLSAPGTRHGRDTTAGHRTARNGSGQDQGPDQGPDQSVDLGAGARAAAAFLRALGQEHRLVALCILAEGERSVGDLARMLGQRQPAVSQHLARLRAEGFVTARRDGTAIYYALARDEVRPVIDLVYELFCAPGSLAPVSAASGRIGPPRIKKSRGKGPLPKKTLWRKTREK